MNRTEDPNSTPDAITWVLQRLPPAPQYIGLFGDAPAVGVARQPHGVDTINDPTNAVRAFFKAVRDSESQLVEYLADEEPRTILNRIGRNSSIDPEFDLLEDNIDSKSLAPSDPNSKADDLIAKAAAFFIRAGGLNPPCQLAQTPERWAFHIERDNSLSNPTEHPDLVLRVHDVADRLRRIQIEQEPLNDVIERNDDDNALFFANVPANLTGTQERKEFISEITGLSGKVAILTSNWEPETLISHADWHVSSVPSEITSPVLQTPAKLICNFDITPREIDFEPYSAEASLSAGNQVQIGHFNDGNKTSSSTPTPPGGSVSVRGGKLLPFRWYGGKFSHLDWLLPLLPECETFVEPFGGSGAVLINRDPSNCEVYNDLDVEVTTFLRVLRGDNLHEESNPDICDETQPARLLRNIALSPFSRAELASAAAIQESDIELPPIERARRFFVRAGQTRSGLAQEASAGRWAYCKGTSRRTMSGAVSRWHGRLAHLYNVSERLGDVEIQNRDAIEVIKEYGNDPDTLIYCDPPYPHATRGDTNSYGFELDEQKHRELAALLNECEAKVALSSYRSDLYAELYDENDHWCRFDTEEKTMHTTKDTRVESLWMNYEPNTLDD